MREVEDYYELEFWRWADDSSIEYRAKNQQGLPIEDEALAGILKEIYLSTVENMEESPTTANILLLENGMMMGDFQRGRDWSSKTTFLTARHNFHHILNVQTLSSPTQFSKFYRFIWQIEWVIHKFTRSFKASRNKPNRNPSSPSPAGSEALEEHFDGLPVVFLSTGQKVVYLQFKEN